MQSDSRKTRARKVATELVYSIHPWRGRSPEFMQATVDKWTAIMLAEFAASEVSGDGTEAPTPLVEAAKELLHVMDRAEYCNGIALLQRNKLKRAIEGAASAESASTNEESGRGK